METMERIVTRFTRALDSYDCSADAQQQICRHLIGILARHTDMHFSRVLEIGCGTGGFTRQLKTSATVDEWLLNDLCEACRPKLNTLFAGQPVTFLSGDAETLRFPGRFDLICSASAFQWMKQPEVFLHKLHTMLCPGGTLLFSTFAPGNLDEVKQITGAGLDYPSTRQLKTWLESDFHLFYYQEEEIKLTFATPLDVLRHLKNTGVTATGTGHWTRGIQEAFCREYKVLYSISPNKVKLTFRPLYVLAVKK